MGEPKFAALAAVMSASAIMSVAAPMFSGPGSPQNLGSTLCRATGSGEASGEPACSGGCTDTRCTDFHLVLGKQGFAGGCGHWTMNFSTLFFLGRNHFNIADSFQK